MCSVANKGGSNGHFVRHRAFHFKKLTFLPYSVAFWLCIYLQNILKLLKRSENIFLYNFCTWYRGSLALDHRSRCKLVEKKEDIRKEKNYEVTMFEAITWKKRLTFLERRRRRRRKINNYASYVDEREIRSGFEKIYDLKRPILWISAKCLYR